MIKPSTVDTSVMRLLAAVAAGIFAAVLAAPIAIHFDFPLPFLAQAGIGVVAGSLCWFASRRVFQFTEDCLNVPSSAMSPALHDTRLKVPTLKATPPAKADAQASAAKPAPSRSDNLALRLAPQPDGSVQVTVDVNGLSKREFNAVRGRFETVPGIKWSHPINLKGGKRQLSGTAKAGPDQQRALSRLEELAGKRS